MIALYVGEIDENKILEITYPFYTSLITEIGCKLRFDSVSNLLGNGGAGSSVAEIVEKHNPFTYKEHKLERLTMANLASCPLAKGR